MALSWTEIKSRAIAFSRKWADEVSERAESQSFWNDFFDVFGISRRRVASFEEPVKKLDQNYGFIDLFWKGTLVIEHKSRGRDLDKAYSQALGYFAGLKEHELPKYVLVSDFVRLRLYDLEEDAVFNFDVKDFHKNIRHFGFIAGYKKQTYKDTDQVNVRAAELLGRLHDELKDSGYTGHDLEVYLVRILFCLFADDTGIFEKNTFWQFIDENTREDGSDLGTAMAQFFQTLDSPEDRRQSLLGERLNAFPYVNGNLFAENLRIAAFNARMRETLLKCCALDWGQISPAIFGAMFQAVMDPEARRNLGAHYTSEQNILKVIRPLFLDSLWDEFERAKRSTKQLKEFHQKLGALTFLDPACGCGNFLVITYRELRLLELEILQELYNKGERFLNIETEIWIDVDQFYGIEVEEWPARIAEVALWLVDHQMNLRISEAFGKYFARLPLRKSPTIFHGNALQIDWNDVIAPENLSYIMGNPPFIGSAYQTASQKEDMRLIFDGIKGVGSLDYVTAWYIKAARYIDRTPIVVAFVSTNSISQGEQVGILWEILIRQYRVKLHFAHRTFSWSNEARGKAAVHVVIVGFSQVAPSDRFIYEYEDIRGEPQKKQVQRINPYLVDGPDVFIQRRSKPLCDVPGMQKGSQPTCGGNLILSDEEKQEFLLHEPQAEPWIRPFMGAHEFINAIKRWCFWLVDISPAELRKMPLLMKRIEAVKTMRLASSKAATRDCAITPTRFQEIRQPTTPYLIVPSVSSERREHIPIGFMQPQTIASNLCLIVPDATLYHFGVLTSTIHMTWVKYVCGRLKSDFRYSNSLVYNNFPWPEEVSDKNRKAVEAAAQGVLDARERFPDASLADLYDPLSMPPELSRAHAKLDQAVDRCYRAKAFKTEDDRIELLFELYAKYTARE